MAACNSIGGGKYHQSGTNYDQRRARGMIMLHRHTALRISDVATFPKEAVSWDQDNKMWRIRVRTQKSGEPVYLPIPETPNYYWTRHRYRGTLPRTVPITSGVAGYNSSHKKVTRRNGGCKLMSHKSISWCPGWDLNPHSPCGKRDFKSLASADFATRAHENAVVITPHRTSIPVLCPGLIVAKGD